METQNPKVKHSRIRILIANSICIIILFLSVSCERRDKSDAQSEFESVVIKDTTINSLLVKLKSYYRFNDSLKGLTLQAEEYVVSDKLAFRINYSTSGTNWKDLEITDMSSFEQCFPMYKNRLGSELFMTNCIGCHTAYPNSADQGICSMYQKNKGTIQEFLKNGIVDSLGTVRHPSFSKLDTLEVNHICNFLEKSCGGSRTNTQE